MTDGSMMSRDWLEDAEHENGNYQCRCYKCSQGFLGHKRRIVCKICETFADHLEQVLSKDAARRKMLERAHEIMQSGIGIARLHLDQNDPVGAKEALDKWCAMLDELYAPLLVPKIEAVDQVATPGWTDLNVQKPGTIDVDHLGDVVFLRSGVECLGCLASGIPVDATHWKRTGRPLPNEKECK